MSFDDFPFDYVDGESFSGDSRQFPGHLEVQSYLRAFAEEKKVIDAIKFKTLVTSVQKT